MRIPFYNTAEKQAALVAEARSWIDTPFRENCAIKGRQGGTDCAWYQNALHSSQGAFSLLNLDTLPVEVVRHHHEHSAASLILAWLKGPQLRDRVTPLAKGELPMIGDFVVMKQEGWLSEHHLGVWCGCEVLHVARNAGVISSSVRNPKIKEIIRSYYRIYA